MTDIRRSHIVRREVWFDEPYDAHGADLLVFYHWSKPPNPAASQLVQSLEIDLTREEHALWSGIAASTRNQINRAAKDGMAFQCWTTPQPETVDRFFAFLHAFATERGMNDEAPVWMHEYAAQGALVLTAAATPEGRELVWHSYSRVPGTVRQLHSVSLGGEAAQEDRRVIGRANRFLHWKDMQEFRKLGITRFDFGGWYGGDSDHKLLGINEFKEQFGGRKTCRYHSMMPVSIKGKLYLLAREKMKHESGLVHYV